MTHAAQARAFARPSLGRCGSQGRRGVLDIVTCQQGIQFLPDRAAGLRQMHRVLRPGGRMALSVWTEFAKLPGHAMLFAALGKVLGVDMRQPPARSLTDATQLLRSFRRPASELEMKLAFLRTTWPSARRFVEIVIAGSFELDTRDVVANPRRAHERIHRRRGGAIARL